MAWVLPPWGSFNTGFGQTVPMKPNRCCNVKDAVHTGQKHHYIPEFYLKRWSNPSVNGRLYEYCRRYQGVVARPTYPGGTGYQRGLYTFSGLDDVARNFLEDVFLGRADDAANDALQRLLMQDTNLRPELRVAWSRYIMTLLHRNPESIQRLRNKVARELPSALSNFKAAWDLARRESDPPTFEEYVTAVPRRDLQQATLMLLQQVMDSQNVGQFLVSMFWSVVTFHTLRYPLLTSDRPLVMTNGLEKADGHLVMPISPNAIFVATRTSEMMHHLHAECDRRGHRIAEHLNDLIARQSHKFVWGTDPHQVSFVSKRIGQKLRSTPLETQE